MKRLMFLMKRLMFLLWVCLFSGVLIFTDRPIYGQSQEVKDYYNSEVRGHIFYLKHPVIRIEHGNPFIGAEDATNVVQNQVRYKARIPGAGLFENDAEGTDAREFKQEAERKISGRSGNLDRQSTIRFWGRGTKIKVHKVQFKDKGKKIYVDITFSSGTKSRIRCYFDTITRPKAEEALSAIFAKSEDELGSGSFEITEGMDIEEVLKAYGKPVRTIKLSSKTVLVYDNLKIIFKDGKLVDVE